MWSIALLYLPFRYSYHSYSYSSFPTYLSSIACRGHEKSIMGCPNAYLNKYSCSRKLSVRCKANCKYIILISSHFNKSLYIFPAQTQRNYVIVVVLVSVGVYRILPNHSCLRLVTRITRNWAVQVNKILTNYTAHNFSYSCKVDLNRMFAFSNYITWIDSRRVLMNREDLQNFVRLMVIELYARLENM